MATDVHDLAILGSGSAAFAAAIRARDLGARVVMVEEATIGGTCVNVGCVPSKALLRAGEVRRTAGLHSFDGIDTGVGPVDMRALVAQKDELVDALRREKYADLLAEYGIDLVRGAGRFTGGGALDVRGEPLEATSYLVATGATPAVRPILGLEEAGYLTSTSALGLDAVPRSIAVVGANAIGLELGQFFLDLGTQVTFFDVLDRIAPFDEPEISRTLAEVLRDEGAEIHTSAQVARGGAPQRAQPPGRRRRW